MSNSSVKRDRLPAAPYLMTWTPPPPRWETE
jgi:hypothetical protein